MNDNDYDLFIISFHDSFKARSDTAGRRTSPSVAARRRTAMRHIDVRRREVSERAFSLAGKSMLTCGSSEHFLCLFSVSKVKPGFHYPS